MYERHYSTEKEEEGGAWESSFYDRCILILRSVGHAYWMGWRCLVRAAFS